MVALPILPVETPTKGPPDSPNQESEVSQPTAPTKGLTRIESAQFLRVTEQTIKNYEKRGLLHPVSETRQDSRGRKYNVWIHDRAELIKARSTILQSREVLDTSTWLTRREAAESLSVATQTLVNYEQRKMLHPAHVRRADKRGREQIVVVYDPKELGKLPRGVGRLVYSRETGELAASCSALFEQGKSNREIVIKLRVTYDEVRELREQWLDGGGAALVINDEARSTLEKMLGPFEDVAGLIMLVKRLNSTGVEKP